jgi:ribosome-associated toxin RatA of RatAB toxin-antitoxin module
MPRIDAVEEGVIYSPPIVVYKAVLEEYAGVTHWWMPHFESKPRGKPIIREGAIVDITVHQKGVTTKFSAKMTKIVEGDSIEMEYAGDVVGTGKWTFEPTDGNTKVQKRVNEKFTKLLVVLLSPFVNLQKANSDLMQKGFKALNSYLSKK